MEQYLDMIEPWVPSSGAMALMIAGVAAGLCLACVLLVSEKTKHIRGKKMLRKETVKKILADGFVDMMLDLHATGQLSTAEVNAEYVKYAKQRGIWDLHPQRLVKEDEENTSFKEYLRQHFGGAIVENGVPNKLASLLMSNQK